MKKSLENNIAITTTKEEFYEELKKIEFKEHPTVKQKIEDSFLKYEVLLKENIILKQENRELKAFKEVTELKARIKEKDLLIEELEERVWKLEWDNDEMSEKDYEI